MASHPSLLSRLLLFTPQPGDEYHQLVNTIIKDSILPSIPKSFQHIEDGFRSDESSPIDLRYFLKHDIKDYHYLFKVYFILYWCFVNESFFHDLFKSDTESKVKLNQFFARWKHIQLYYPHPIVFSPYPWDLIVPTEPVAETQHHHNEYIGVVYLVLDMATYYSTL